jgi:hypothetical protein
MIGIGSGKLKVIQRKFASYLFEYILSINLFLVIFI